MVVIHELQQIKLELISRLHQPNRRKESEMILWRYNNTYFDVKLDALILKNRALASEATAFAC
jgi:hypothetical protein